MEVPYDITLTVHEGQALLKQNNLFKIYGFVEGPVGNSLLSQGGLHSSVLYPRTSLSFLPQHIVLSGFLIRCIKTEGNFGSTTGGNYLIIVAS